MSMDNESNKIDGSLDAVWRWVFGDFISIQLRKLPASRKTIVIFKQPTQTQDTA